jgi:phage-related minor tail protein
MDEEIERLVVSVRADTRGFAADVGAMRAELDGPFAVGLDRAGQALERSLGRAIQTGKFGFDDLRRVALSVLSEIASAAIHSGLNSITGGEGGASAGTGAGGLLASLSSALGSVFGAPGRATGGPVSPGRPYRVGENGPELFVPTSSGRIETGGFGRTPSSVNMTIHVSDNGRGSAPDALQRSSRQVARAVRQALIRAGE